MNLMEMPTDRLKGALEQQLDRIAKTHRGKVPLHGRLFAQWMHFAFPQECPFPHRAGGAAVKTPEEFGDAYVATPDEMEKHVAGGQRQESMLLPANASDG